MCKLTKYVYREKDFDIKEHVIALKPFWDEKILEMGVKKIPEDDYEYLDLVNSHPDMVQARINQFVVLIFD